MKRYTDGEDWYDCTEFEGILFAVTADEKVAIVDVLPAAEVAANDKAELQHPTVAVIVMETETYYDGSTGLWKHFFDVELDDSMLTLKVSVAGRHVKEIVHFG
ncbi:hypothetical protein MUK42_12229 [Musa troglodytarum]|uniref:Uncharacterized protein n=1 Tax=Musa troglodytarum TaxID=320322 RepID=A0A9E7KEK4_9LILI|nr:hypothetical protein MUK42_12229 [Musa troglodytarum]